MLTCGCRFVGAEIVPSPGVRLPDLCPLLGWAMASGILQAGTRGLWPGSSPSWTCAAPRLGPSKPPAWALGTWCQRPWVTATPALLGASVVPTWDYLVSGSFPRLSDRQCPPHSWSVTQPRGMLRRGHSLFLRGGHLRGRCVTQQSPSWGPAWGGGSSSSAPGTPSCACGGASCG